MDLIRGSDLAKRMAAFFGHIRFHPNSKSDAVMNTLCKEASPEYCEIRVIELAREMKELRQSGHVEKMYLDRATMAARLLALAVGKVVTSEIKSE